MFGLAARSGPLAIGLTTLLTLSSVAWAQEHGDGVFEQDSEPEAEDEDGYVEDNEELDPEDDEEPPDDELDPEESEELGDAGQAHADEEPSLPAARTKPPALPEPSIAPSKNVEEVLVTGSAIRRKDLVTPAPVTMLIKTDMEASGMVSIGDILQNLPAQSNAINTQANNGGDGSTRISLRGLGTSRTLVLVNGRRHVPGGNGANSSVDLNAIPAALIERVEVLKDGASALYGSDAIGGVVNIITRKDFSGSEINLYTGTAVGGGTIYDVNFTTGVASDEGFMGFSAGYYRMEPLFAGAREWSRSALTYLWDAQPGDAQTRPNGSTRVPEGYLRDRSGAFGNGEWQAIRGRASTTRLFHDPSMGWRDFNGNGVSDVPRGEPGHGDRYNYQPENYLVTPQQRYNVFVTGAYQLGDENRVYFEGSYVNRQSDQKLAPTPLSLIGEDIVLSKDNYYNPFGRDLKDVQRRMLEAGTRNYIQDLDTFRLVMGMDGEIPGTQFNWDFFFNFGRTSGKRVTEGRFIRSRVAAALGPSYIGSDGIPHCGTVQNPGPDDCIPLNLLGGAGTITQDMLDYIAYRGAQEGFTEHRGVVLQTAGQLAESPWGGPIGLALGTTYRQLRGAVFPDPVTNSGDTTGNKKEATAGSYGVYEGYVELSGNILEDKPLFETLELTAAARMFNYTTFGSGLTWKAGGRWQLFQLVGLGGLALRGTVSTAFRAPTIGQLFSGAGDSFPHVSDPCDTSQGPRDMSEQQNCQAAGLPDSYVDTRDQIRSRVGGNTELDPETANIWTAGVVWEPGFAPGLSITSDVYSVMIDNTITPIGAGTILSTCYAQPNPPANCSQLVQRDPTGFITNIIDVQQNIGALATSGIDFGVAHTLRSDAGRFRTAVDLSYLIRYDETQPDGTVIRGKNVYDLGVFPSWRVHMRTSWEHEGLNLGVNARFIQGFRECEDDDCRTELKKGPDANVRNVAPNVTADLFAGYEFVTAAGRTRMTAGVNNVLDADPPYIDAAGINTSSSNYPFLGRFPYLRIRHTF